MYGITETGFVKKRQPQIRREIEDDIRAVTGPEMSFAPTTVEGQIVGIISEREAKLWELLEDIYNSAFPDTATGASLINAVALTGTRALPATHSRVTARIMGTFGTFIPQQMSFSVAGIPTSKFLTTASDTIGPGINEVQKISFSAVPAAGNWTLSFDGLTTTVLSFQATTGNVQSALNNLSNLSGVVVTGSFSGSFTVEFTGDSGQKIQPLITANSLLQDGNGNPVEIVVTEEQRGYPPFVDMLLRAVRTGPITAPAGTLTVIDTPLFGVDSVTNLLDATVGRDVETSAQLRLRRLDSLKRSGTTTAEGIRSSILQVAGVETAFVFMNLEIHVVDGRPPKSFEVYAQGGDDEEIFQKVWETQPAGIQPFGNLQKTIIDSQGFPQVVAFSRPQTVLIYMQVTLEINDDPSEPGGVYPVNGDELVRDAILAYGNTFEIGQDVVWSRFFTPINLVPGVIGIDIKLGTSQGSLQSGNVSILPTQLAQFDSTRLEVISV